MNCKRFVLYVLYLIKGASLLVEENNLSLCLEESAQLTIADWTHKCHTQVSNQSCYASGAAV